MHKLGLIGISASLFLGACVTTSMPDTTATVRTHWHGDVKLTYNPQMDMGKSVVVGVPITYGARPDVSSNSDQAVLSVSSTPTELFDGIRLTKINFGKCRLEEQHIKDIGFQGVDHGFPTFTPDVDVFTQNVLCNSGKDTTWKLP